MSNKLNVLLAKTDHLAASYHAHLKNYIQFFRNKQAHFLGEKRTYTPKEGVVDDPKRRGITLLVTTVAEKLDYFKTENSNYIDSLFSVEATNASSEQVILQVDGKSWGKFTSLELLRLKTLLESSELKGMLMEVPMRSDAEVWNPCTEEMYTEREVFESPMTIGITKTTEKESYILKDPNVDKSSINANYVPQLGTKNTVVELGDYTQQKFSGEVTQTWRANVLARRSNLLNAVIVALKKVNEQPVKQSALTADRLFGYLFK